MQFLKGDCLEVMKTLPSKSIDCFVCDLPYGCLTGVKKHAIGQDNTYIKDGKETFGCSWDIKINLDLFWTQIKRLAKNDHTPVLMFCTTKFGAELINSNPDWFRYDLVWSKPSGTGFLMANKMPLRSHEMIYVFAKKGTFYKRIDIEGDFQNTNKGPRPKIINTYQSFNNTAKESNEGKRCVKSVVEIANKKCKGNHPTQKPAELYEWLLKRYCPEGGTILDPTAGSFASCFIAKKLGLNAIGIEMNEEFYQKAFNCLPSL